MGAAALPLAFRKVRQKIGLEKKDNDSSDATAAKTDAKTDATKTDSAATGSSAIYDGMLSEDAVAKARKRKASTGTMVDDGSQTFGGGALGS